MRLVGTVLLFLTGALLIAAGAAVLQTFGTQGQLHLEGPSLSASPGSRAIVVDVEGIEVGIPAAGSVGEVTLGVISDGGDPMFVGLGSTTNVNDYLGASSFDSARLESGHWELISIRGSGTLPPPGQESFWTRRGQGIDPVLTYRPVPDGETTFAVMRPDASTGISVRIVVGYRSGVIGPAAIGAAVVGLLLIVLAGVLRVRGRRHGGRSGPRAGTESVGQQANAPESWFPGDEARSVDGEERA